MKKNSQTTTTEWIASTTAALPCAFPATLSALAAPSHAPRPRAVDALAGVAAGRTGFRSPGPPIA